MKTCLVVFYSHTGMTRRVADAIRGTYSCDIEQIREVTPRTGWTCWMRSMYEALSGKQSPIRPPQKDPADYALVILGTPVWAGRVASPMRSYIAQNKQHFHKIAAFCTMGGSGDSKVFAQIGQLCGQQPISTLALSDQQIDNNQYLDNISQFRKSLAQMPT